MLPGDSEDLIHLSSLDRKLWVALACPTRSLEMDARTLALLDADGDGRIRARDIRLAVQWLCRCLRNPGEILSDPGQLSPEALCEDSPESASLLHSFRTVLSSLGKPTNAPLTPADTGDTVRIFASNPFNGDGVLVAAAIASPELLVTFHLIRKVQGTVSDRSQQPGLDRRSVDEFFRQLRAFEKWWRQADSNDPESRRDIVLPLGDETARAWKSLQTVRSKIEDFFTRCALLEFAPKAEVHLERPVASWADALEGEIQVNAEAIASLPLARPCLDQELDLQQGINPAWKARIGDFLETVVLPLLGPDITRLKPTEWRRLTDVLEPYGVWQAQKGLPAIAEIGIERVRSLLASNHERLLYELIERDLAVAPAMSGVESVDRLVRFYCFMGRLLRNFVSFQDFYDFERRATFQAGTLFLDGRSSQLCVRVDDPARHAQLAATSRLYLVYAECSRKDSPIRITIAAAFTNGDPEGLTMGRNGLFLDRQDQDWDAQVIRVLENPISLREGFLSPYKRAVRMVETQVEKLALARDKSNEEQFSRTLTSAGGQLPANQVPGPQTSPAQPAGVPFFNLARYAGIFAAIGLALGAMGTAMAGFLGTLMGLRLWHLPIGIAGLLLVISGPAVIVTWLKLRQRSFTPVLDACGWALNGRLKISPRLGRSFTRLAELPPGSRRTLQDPFTRRRRPWKRWVLVVTLAIILSSTFWHRIETGTWWWSANDTGGNIMEREADGSGNPEQL